MTHEITTDDQHFTHHHRVHRLVETAILANVAVAVLAMLDDAHEPVYGALETGLLVFFCAELLAKLARQRHEFWRSGWNLFDAAVTIAAVMPLLLLGADTSVLRIARVARIVHVGRHATSLRVVGVLCRRPGAVVAVAE